jgi:outer membrane protein TolC
MRLRSSRPVWVAAICFLVPAAVAAQGSPIADTLRLGALQDAAVDQDPRGRQVELLAAQSSMRLRGLSTEWLPRIDVAGRAQYQSETFALPFEIPGSAPFSPQRDTYDASVGVRQALFDPAIGARRSVERARVAESQARVRSALFALRQGVADAYFTVLLLDAQRAELDAGIAELDAQLRVARERVDAGQALPSSVATLEAERLRRQQALVALAADRRATLVVLGDLAGRAIPDSAPLGLPDLAPDVARAEAELQSVRRRPEYARFARSRESLDAERGMIARRSWPRLSAVGRAGIGRPGLNPLSDSFRGYWLAGLQLEWSPFDWGRTRLDRQALNIQQEIVDTDEAAFTREMRRRATRELAAVRRLEDALAADSAIIALRDEVLRETRLRFAEGVVTSAEFVDRETDLLSARLARVTHRVELAQARARFLILLGLETT